MIPWKPRAQFEHYLGTGATWDRQKVNIEICVSFMHSLVGILKQNNFLHIERERRISKNVLGVLPAVSMIIFNESATIFLAQAIICICGNGGHGMYYYRKNPQQISGSSYTRVIYRNIYIQTDWITLLFRSDLNNYCH